MIKRCHVKVNTSLSSLDEVDEDLLLTFDKSRMQWIANFFDKTSLPWKDEKLL